MKLTCIVCPNGCSITVDGDKVSGYKCKRGLDFAKNESVNPKRTVTGTVKTIFKNMPRLPVKTDKELSKGRIFELMALLKEIVVDYDVKIGDIIIENALDEDVNVIATADIDFACVNNNKLN
ncbi:MAG: DUF1667 domain-containing protein [Clostridia bacterium]